MGEPLQRLNCQPRRLCLSPSGWSELFGEHTRLSGGSRKVTVHNLSRGNHRYRVVVLGLALSVVAAACDNITVETTSTSQVSPDTSTTTTAAAIDPSGPVPVIVDYSPTVSDVGGLMYLLAHPDVVVTEAALSVEVVSALEPPASLQEVHDNYVAEMGVVLQAHDDFISDLAAAKSFEEADTILSAFDIESACLPMAEAAALLGVEVGLLCN